MLTDEKFLWSVPNFPNYTFDTFGYPERLISKKKDSLVILGPPIQQYFEDQPDPSCQVHVSGIPHWASMAEVAAVVERFGKIFTIELSLCITPFAVDSSHCNGWARVTYQNYDGAQNALFAHLTRRIPGSMSPLSIYKGDVSNVVLLKNLPPNEPKSQLIERINDYPGVLSISFVASSAARVVFIDLDSALLFMDIVSSEGLVIQGFTCTIDTVTDLTDDDDDGIICEGDDKKMKSKAESLSP